MAEYPEIGRWRIYGAKDHGVTYYQGKDSPPDVWVVPCDEEAIQRAMAAVPPSTEFEWTDAGRRMIAEAVLKGASGR